MRRDPTELIPFDSRTVISPSSYYSFTLNLYKPEFPGTGCGHSMARTYPYSMRWASLYIPSICYRTDAFLPDAKVEYQPERLQIIKEAISTGLVVRLVL